MKRFLLKIPGMIALLISIVSFVLVISALIVSRTEIPPDTGLARSFQLWVFSVIFAFIGVVFYAIDAGIVFSYRSELNHCSFHYVFCGLEVLSIVMLVLIGGSPGICILIWNIYYLTLFVMELISMKLLCFSSDGWKRQ